MTAPSAEPTSREDRLLQIERQLAALAEAVHQLREEEVSGGQPEPNHDDTSSS